LTGGNFGRARLRGGIAQLVRAALILCLALVACSGSGDNPTPPEDDSAVVIGAYDFTESKVLAHIYAGALESNGYDVRVVDSISSREIMEPALEQGLVQFVPEYQGTMLNFLTGGKSTGVHRPRAASQELAEQLEQRGITLLQFAPAQNRNEIVVTGETAARYGLERISDLRRVASRMVFGGPPECPLRPLCLPGLEETYGLHFKSFQPLDVGGPLTVNALTGGEIDVGLLFTTDPALVQRDLVVLEDDRGLQPAENIVPVVRRDVVNAYGGEFVGLVNSITNRLSTTVLQQLNGGVDIGGADPAAVAEKWLVEEARVQ
jgi:osmoprotectant transport system substrate-binding protein